MKFNEKLKLMREKNGYTITQVAKAARVRAKTMEKYESGMEIPKLKTIIKIAEFYGFSTAELFQAAMTEVNEITEAMKKGSDAE